MEKSLESRRSFFKSALKKSLPIIGIGLAAQLPMLTQAAGVAECQGCRIGCSGGCTGSCDSSCKGSCSGTCRGGCGDVCGSW